MNQTKKMSMENKVTIITGSSRGIGKAIALEFARQGAKVVVTYHREAAQAEAVVQEIRSIRGEALAAQLLTFASAAV